MAFTVPAPVRRRAPVSPSPGLERAADMLVRFQMNKISLAQNQKQFDLELAHRKLVDSQMTANQAATTGADVRKSDAQVSLFNAQEKKVKAENAFNASPRGQMLKFSKARREGQGAITKVWTDMMNLQSPNMTNAAQAETFSHILASTMQATSLDPDSTMESFLPTARNNSNLIFNAQANQDMRTANSLIEQFNKLDEKSVLKKNLGKSIGTLQRIASGEEFPRAEVDRIFNAAQFNLDPDKNIDIAGFFNSAPASRLTDEQLIDFRLAGKGSLADRRLVQQEGQGRGLTGFEPAASTANSGANALSDPSNLTGTPNLETKTGVDGRVLVRNPADGLWYDREDYLKNPGR